MQTFDSYMEANFTPEFRDDVAIELSLCRISAECDKALMSSELSKSEAALPEAVSKLVDSIGSATVKDLAVFARALGLKVEVKFSAADAEEPDALAKALAEVEVLKAKVKDLEGVIEDGEHEHKETKDDLRALQADFDNLDRIYQRLKDNESLHEKRIKDLAGLLASKGVLWVDCLNIHAGLAEAVREAWISTTP